MPKKQAPNGFLLFMLDYKKQEEGLGRKFNGGLRDVTEECGIKWKELPPSVRQDYDNKAKNAKKNGPASVKYTSQGERVDHVLARHKEAQDIEHMKQQAVHGMVYDSRDVLNKTFFLIDVNFYCQTKDIYVINEVALVAFSVKEGLQIVFHRIIDPKSIPMGYMSTAKQSAEVHGFGLPPLDIEDATSDMVVVLSELLDFMNTVMPKDPGQYALFTTHEKMQPVQSFLDQLYINCDDGENKFDLYPLSELYFKLVRKLNTTTKEVMPKVTLAEIALAQDKFGLSPGLACDYHQEQDTLFNCVKSRTKSWAYTVLDQVCPIAGVEMVSGDHVPEVVDPEEALRIKAQREEAREEEERREREREANKNFSFIDYAAEPQRGAPALRPWGGAPPVPVGDSAWPSLGGPKSRTPAPAPPPSVWGRPSSSASVAGAPASAPPSAPAVAPSRAPLKKPGFDLGSMMRDPLSLGIGRGSVTSLHSNL